MESEEREDEQRAAVALKVGEFLSIKIKSECCAKSNKTQYLIENKGLSFLPQIKHIYKYLSD